jgi:hypothetical protein
MLNVRIVVLGRAALLRCTTLQTSPGAAGPAFAATTFFNA